MQLLLSYQLRRWIICTLAIMLLLAGEPVRATAAGLELYAKAFQANNSHLRTATAYLRTGNNDLAAFELEAYLEKWTAFKPGNDEIKTLIEKARKDITLAVASIDSGKPDEAKRILGRVREAFRKLHRSTGVDVFADCIFDADAAAIPLWVNRRERPDLEQATEVARVKSETLQYSTALAACNERAPEIINGDREFRRLMDGSLQSLSRIPVALDNKDSGYLYRLLIELRAFARLLVFRYG